MLSATAEKLEESVWLNLLIIDRSLISPVEEKTLRFPFGFIPDLW
jgi:hypothetical protein